MFAMLVRLKWQKFKTEVILMVAYNLSRATLVSYYIKFTVLK